MLELTQDLLAGMVRELYGTTTLERHGATLSFEPPFARRDYYGLVRETAGIDLARATEAELRAALERKEVADADALTGGELLGGGTEEHPSGIQSQSNIVFPLLL